MLFRITQRRIHSICFFWPPLCFSVVECVLPSIFNSKCKIQTALQIREAKVSSCSSDPLGSFQCLRPLLALVFLISMLFHLSFLHPLSSPLFLSHLSVPPCLIPAFVFQYTTLEDTKKKSRALAKAAVF